MSKDLRPKRVRKPKVWMIIVALFLTPATFMIPLVGWIFSIMAWWMIYQQYRQGTQDEQLPYGHFKGEDFDKPIIQAPKGMSIFKD